MKKIIVPPKLLLACRRYLRFYSNSAKDADTTKEQVYITAAVRTPMGKLNGSLNELTAPQMGSMAIEMALKQAGMPFEMVQEVFMGNALPAGTEEVVGHKAAFGAQLYKSIRCTIVQDEGDLAGLRAIMKAAEILKTGEVEVVVAGGMESASNVPYYKQRSNSIFNIWNAEEGGILKAGDAARNAQLFEESKGEELARKLGFSKVQQSAYFKDMHSRFVNAWTDDAYAAEVVPVSLQQNRHKKLLVQEDESLYNFPLKEEDDELRAREPTGTMADGAAALVLTTASAARISQTKPLARIVAFREEETNALNMLLERTQLFVQQFLQQIGHCAEDIALWEIAASHCPLLPLALSKQMHLDATRINGHGNAICWGRASALTVPCLVTHLVHELAPGELGCAMLCSAEGDIAAVCIEKLYPVASFLPTITLYTKDICQLCDVVVQDLETNFSGQYKLHKVDITQEGNMKLRRLYRYDIPVLFLNGQFLCMHKLNVNLLRRRLAQFQRFNAKCIKNKEIFKV